MAFCEEDVIEILSSDEDILASDKPQATDGRHLLDEFIKVCQPLLKSNQQKAVSKLLRDKFNEAKESYTQSECFRHFVRQRISDLQTTKKSVYVHIQEVKTLLIRESNTRRVELTAVKIEKTEEAKPAIKKVVEEKVDPQTNEECAKSKRDDEQDVNKVQQVEFQSESLLMTCETVSSGEYAADKKDPTERRTGGEPGRSDHEDGAGPSSSLPDPASNSVGTPDAEAGSIKSPPAEDGKGQSKGKGSRKQIQRLENLLHKLDKAIKKLQERELTLDEMDESDSTHIQEFQLRKRFVKVYNMLCKLNGCAMDTGRVIEQRIRYKGTRFPEINRRLERLVNKRDFFPDFHDVYIAVQKTNVKKDLGLDKNKVKSIAQEAFEDLGGKLQKRRQQDFLLNFSAHSTLDFIKARDEVGGDPELKRKLMENRELAKQNIKQVEDAFVRRQEECEKSGVNLEASEHSESNASSEGPSEAEEDKNAPVLKKARLELDEDRNGNEENGGKENGQEDLMNETKEDETGGQDDNGHGRDGSTSPPSQMQQQLQTQVPTNKNTLLRNVPHAAFHKELFSTNLNASYIAHNGSSETGFNENGVDQKIHSVGEKTHGLVCNPAPTSNIGTGTQLAPVPQCPQSPQLCFDTPEQAVECLGLTPSQPAMPSSTMPLVITNVCSLSDDPGFFNGSGKTAWDEGKATIAKVVDDGSGSIVIEPPTQQRIMVVQSGKRVKLKTSTPITLSFEDAETNSNTQLSKAKSDPSPSHPSPPPSVSSTQPELDTSPDVEEVVEIAAKSLAPTQREKLLESASSTGTATRQAPCAQQRNRTGIKCTKEVVVSESSSYVRCNSCMQMCAEAKWHNHSCPQSAHGSRKGMLCSPRRANSCVRQRSAPAVVPSRAFTNTSGPCHDRNTAFKSLTAQGRVFSLKPGKNLTQYKTSPKWQAGPQQRNSRFGKPSRQVNSTTNKDDEDSDVVIISDSEQGTSEQTGDQSESPEVICISDSD
ncbi:death domain-associated protein 6-like [Acanthaster planci]|uniref:Death domain-associated protein 6 n=1 Tax=Acanthaster planci TaxID=133434 RepID=A0A8B7XTQ9_ACAPL|nr:death domain-associated protein 6-like [Acanthaster planci]